MAVAEQPVKQKTASKAQEIEIQNPISGETIGTVPITPRDEVAAVVERARSAQVEWGARSVKERGKIIRRWADMIWDARDELIRIIRDESGKVEAGALTEILVFDSLIQYYYSNAHKILKPQKRRTLFPGIERAKVYYKPHGVVGVISPWNYPFVLPMMDVVPALFAGNAVVFKPSEVTAFSGQFAVDKMREAGIPHDVIQTVHGDGTTGAALVDYVDYIAFTGSTAVGRKVAMRAAERLIPSSIELGGKDPAIILKDANLDMAAAGILRGALENAGQVCISVERVYVEAAIYDQFVDKLQHYAEKLKIGSDPGMDVHMGSMTNQRELLRCEGHIKDAVDKGAEVIYGGKRRPDLGPNFLEPTIVVNVDHSMDIMREESFGPLLPVMKVNDVDEAIRLANDNEYGLSASIYTGNLKRGEQLALKIDTGDVSINRSQIVTGTPSLPMGGQKHSGIGRRNGPEGLLRFTAPQSVLVDNLFAQKPDLRHLDPMTLRTFLLLRKLRRWLPFI